MNAPLSIAFNPLAEADQLHAARSVMVKLRDNAAGRWAEDAYSDCVVLLDQAIENEADERGETINAGYVDYIVETTCNDMGGGWSRVVPQ